MAAKISKMYGGEGYERPEHNNFRTPAWVTNMLLDNTGPFPSPVWEPAAGEGDMACVLRERRLLVMTSDIRPTGTGYDGLDFCSVQALSMVGSELPRFSSVITNPPFDLAADFITRALVITCEAVGKVAMLLPFAYDTALTTRGDLFRHPAFVGKIVLGRRITWVGLESKPGERKTGPRQEHAWFIWDWAKPKPARPIIIYPSVLP